MAEYSSLLRFAENLIRVPSPSGSEGPVAELVAREMASNGYEVEVDDLGNVLGWLRFGPGPVVLFDAHMDTVGVTDPSSWSRRPEGELRGSRLYGRGAMDMKGPLAACLHGLAAVQGEIGKGTIVVCASVAEELVEGVALSPVLERVKPACVVICEATSLQVAHGQRGRAEIKVEIFGQPTHSSRPHLGVNALDAMSLAMGALKGLPAPFDPVLGEGVLVATDILSRPYPALSVVPDYCVATYDRRTLPGETAESVLAPLRTAIESAIHESGARAELSIAIDDFVSYSGAHIRAPNFAPAWCLSPQDSVVTDVLAELHREGLESDIRTYAFCTNGSASAGQLGIHTLGYGPGDEELAHRVDEFIEVDDLVSGAQGYAALGRALTRRDW